MRGEGRAWRSGPRGHRVDPSELVAAQPRLDEEEVDETPTRMIRNIIGGDRRAHVRVAELQLEAEEGAVEEGAEDVGREVRAGSAPCR